MVNVSAVAWFQCVLPWKRSMTKSRLRNLCDEFVEARPPALLPSPLLPYGSSTLSLLDSSYVTRRALQAPKQNPFVAATDLRPVVAPNLALKHVCLMLFTSMKHWVEHHAAGDVEADMAADGRSLRRCHHFTNIINIAAHHVLLVVECMSIVV